MHVSTGSPQKHQEGLRTKFGCRADRTDAQSPLVPLVGASTLTCTDVVQLMLAMLSRCQKLCSDATIE